VLLLLSSFVPGAVLFVLSRECRSVTFRLKAGFGVYAKAVLIGVFLPFSSYLGGKIVLAQREMEKRRSPLVHRFRPFGAGIF